jgi:regulator of protease activity HflC (stomatin/prohibitin superfamily)
LQVIPTESVLYRVYQKAIGERSMDILSSFNDLPMYNFGIRVVQEMSDDDRVFLEQNVQASLAQKEIDLEDAMAVRQVKDVDQAQRLLAVKRKKRIELMQKQQQANIQAQAQANAQASQVAAQAEMQRIQMEAQIEAQKIQMKGQVEVQVAAALHQMKKELEMIRAQASLGFKTEDKEFKEKIETLKEDRKDDRVVKQAVEQSKLISQRQGSRGELDDSSVQGNQDVINELFGNE